MDKYLAAVCSICPFCIAKRRWPKSGYAQAYRKVERFCPFCKAYARRRAVTSLPKKAKSRR